MSKYKKKLIFFSTSRSDFDLQKGLILKLQKKFNCKLICGPQHFYKNSGYSYTDVSKSGIKNIKKLISRPDNKKTILLNNFFFENFSKEINLYKPDLACLFGDRSEILIAAFNLYFQNVKIVHFHGGEVTHGSKDDGYRHAISKLSDFHIVTTVEHKKRLIQLGEYKKNIFNFGSLSLDEKQIKDKKNKVFFEKKFKTKLNKFNYLVTLHPDKTNSKKNYETFFLALSKVKDTNYYITSPNLDPGSNLIRELILLYSNKSNFFNIKNLGTNYFNFLNFMNGVIGNSSSGISEVPSLKKITINVGARQSGRPMAKSIICTDYSLNEIKNAINSSNSLRFKKDLKCSKNFFYKKNAVGNSLKVIEKILKNEIPSNKKFNDLNF